MKCCSTANKRGSKAATAVAAPQSLSPWYQTIESMNGTRVGEEEEEGDEEGDEAAEEASDADQQAASIRWRAAVALLESAGEEEDGDRGNSQEEREEPPTQQGTTPREAQREGL